MVGSEALGARPGTSDVPTSSPKRGPSNETPRDGLSCFSLFTFVLGLCIYIRSIPSSFPADWSSSPDLALRPKNQLGYGHGRQYLTQGHHRLQHRHQGNLRRWSCKEPRVT